MLGKFKSVGFLWGIEWQDTHWLRTEFFTPHSPNNLFSSDRLNHEENAHATKYPPFRWNCSIIGGNYVCR